MKISKTISMLSILALLFLTGCSQEEKFTITSEELTQQESELLTLTGNRVFKYNLKNRPNDKSYNLNLVYEVYKKGEKIKEEKLMEILQEPIKEKIEDSQLAYNIQDNKIRCLIGGALKDTDIKEDISKLSYMSYSNETEINYGDEIYLFHASSGENGFVASNLGKLPVENKNACIEDNDVNIFIKLDCKEINE